MADDQDRAYVKEAEAALSALYDKYAAAKPGDQWVLRPAIAKAADEMLAARMALFKEGTLIKPGDMDKLRQLKRDIDNAADAQQLVMFAIKLAATLGAFV